MSDGYFSFEVTLNDSLSYVSPSRYSGKEAYKEVRKKDFEAFVKRDETMDEILQRYRKHLCGRNIKHETVKNYLKHVKVFLHVVSKLPSSIIQDDVDSYVRRYLDNNKQNGNCSRFYAVRRFLSWEGRDDLEIPKMLLTDSKKLALNDEQVKKLFNTVEKMSALHRVIFYLEYDGIRRPSEVRHIRLVDRNGDMLYYRGKTHSDYIVLSERLIKAWDEYVAFERPHPKSKEDSEYLLLSVCNKWRGKRLHSNVLISRIIKEVISKSGIKIPHGESATNYLIKRTSITRQLKTCPDPKLVQLQAGHSKLSTTMKYNRVSDTDRRRYIKNLEREHGYNGHITNSEKNERISYKTKTLFMINRIPG